ncbi:MAG: tRNA (cytidine(34)-2'-O)-methyltransferase [Magnetococcales bacterium]|nr:tRNA (cytidine(34)-2'-O)-methyltransferase [Magnetococcales bacterium]
MSSFHPVNPLHVILYQPEIPPNTGSVMRLCAASGTTLHLIGPLGFRLDGAGVRRAQMDYRLVKSIQRHVDWQGFQNHWQTQEGRLFGLSTHGEKSYHQARFQPGDGLLFGSEGSGLPERVREALGERLVRIPMASENRSLNLAVSVGITLYEAQRQCGFPGLA